MDRNIFYSIEEIKEFFKSKYNAEVVAEKRISSDVYLFNVHRIPKNRKPNWIWHAFRFSKKFNFEVRYYWRIIPLTEKHLSGFEHSQKVFFEWYDSDNKNLRLAPRFNGDKNIAEGVAK